MVEYEGDANNEASGLACNAPNQASAVAAVTVSLSASAGSGAIGGSVDATATLGNGAIPTGQLTFQAFPPTDLTCSGTPAFSSTVDVAGNGAYGSAPFSPLQIGSFRWLVTYSGDVNHEPAATAR